MSSIFDALRKLEDQKGEPREGGPGDELFRPPAKRGHGNTRRGSVLAVAVLLAVGGGYFFWPRDDAKDPLESTVTPPAKTASVVQAPVPEAPVPEAPTPPSPAPSASEAPGAPVAGQPAVQPTVSQNFMTDAQRLARAEMLRKYAALQASTSASEAGEGAAAPAPGPSPAAAPVPEPAPSLPAAVPGDVAVGVPGDTPAEVRAPAPAAPVAVIEPSAAPSLPLDNRPAPITRVVPEAPAPPAVPARVATAEDLAPPPALAPEPKPLIETDYPMLTVTEVTHHVRPENRWARIKIGKGPARKVREGDDVQGIHVGEIQFGSVALQMAGTDVVVEVGESVSFTVSEPDFH